MLKFEYCYRKCEEITIE